MHSTNLDMEWVGNALEAGSIAAMAAGPWNILPADVPGLITALCH